MGALRDFVADLLESEGAAVEPLEPDGLEVLAPRAAAHGHGLAGAGAARLRRGAAARGAIADRARGRLARPVRRAARRRGPLERAAGSCSPRRFRRRATPNGCSIARSICRTRSGASRRMSADLDALPDAGVPLHRRFGREARGTGLARLQPRHRRGGQRHPGAAAAGAGADGRLARARLRRRGARPAPAWSAATLAARVSPLLDQQVRGSWSRSCAPCAAGSSATATGSTPITTTCARASLKRLAALAGAANGERRRPTAGARRCGSRRSSANTRQARRPAPQLRPARHGRMGPGAGTLSCRCSASRC